jgi:hypothetical protein
MNIFVLDKDPMWAALYHNNKHIVKMILEYGQLLSGAYYGLSTCKNTKDYLKISSSRLKETNYPRENFIKLTHKHHPCMKFSMESIENWNWLLELFNEVLSEYTYRYAKIHLFQPLYFWFKNNPPDLPSTGKITWVKAMPDYLKLIDEPVLAYRQYYIQEKQHLAKWTDRDTPPWFIFI